MRVYRTTKTQKLSQNTNIFIINLFQNNFRTLYQSHYIQHCFVPAVEKRTNRQNVRYSANFIPMHNRNSRAAASRHKRPPPKTNNKKTLSRRNNNNHHNHEEVEEPRRKNERGEKSTNRPTARDEPVLLRRRHANAAKLHNVYYIY